MSDILSSNSCLKSVCSVSELAKLLNLSRARFYQLINLGKFPSPVYNIHTKRPCYTQELQEICLRIRRTNIAFDNTPIMFYSPRKKKILPPKISAPKITDKSIEPNSQYEDFVENLNEMGLTGINYEQVETSIKEKYPNGLPDDEGTILRDLFNHFRHKA